jgi:hypothetical protein
MMKDAFSTLGKTLKIIGVAVLVIVLGFFTIHMFASGVFAPPPNFLREPK